MLQRFSTGFNSRNDDGYEPFFLKKPFARFAKQNLRQFRYEISTTRYHVKPLYKSLCGHAVHQQFTIPKLEVDHESRDCFWDANKSTTTAQ